MNDKKDNGKIEIRGTRTKTHSPENKINIKS